MLQKLLNNPDSIIALCALITSIVSIFFTYRGLRLQKIHNLKSVRPIGVIITDDYEDDIYVRIDNNGIGPMIVKEIKVFSALQESSSIIDLVPESLNEKVVWADFLGAVQNRAIMPGNDLYLIRLTFDEADTAASTQHETRKEVRDFLQHLTVELSYTDVYEKTMFKTTRKLDWFARHF